MKQALGKSSPSEEGYGSDGSAGSHGSFTPSVAARLNKLPQFSSKDSERLTTSLAPDAIVSWLEDFTDSIEDYSEDDVSGHAQQVERASSREIYNGAFFEHMVMDPTDDTPAQWRHAR